VLSTSWPILVLVAQYTDIGHESAPNRVRFGPGLVPGQHPVLGGEIGGLTQYTDIGHESPPNWVWFGPGQVPARHPILGDGVGGLRQIGADLRYDPSGLALV
jgi:hypothetical protein